MTGAEVTRLINATGLSMVEIAKGLSITVLTLEGWMLAGIPEQFSGSFEAGLKWVEYLATRATDEQIADIYSRIDQSMERSAKLLHKQYIQPERDI